MSKSIDLAWMTEAYEKYKDDSNIEEYETRAAKAVKSLKDDPNFDTDMLHGASFVTGRTVDGLHVWCSYTFIGKHRERYARMFAAMCMADHDDGYSRRIDRARPTESYHGADAPIYVILHGAALDISQFTVSDQRWKQIFVNLLQDAYPIEFTGYGAVDIVTEEAKLKGGYN